MADSTVVNLTAVTTPALTDLVAVRQSGDTRDKKETLAQVRSVVSHVTSFLAGNATNATATMAVTGLSVTVASGVKYAVEGNLLYSDSTFGDGAKFDLDTSSAGITDLRVMYTTHLSDSTVFQTTVTAFATDHDITTLAIDGFVERTELSGSFEVSTGGTFLVRFAQSAHSTGTLTLYRGSWLKLTPMG